MGIRRDILVMIIEHYIVIQRLVISLSTVAIPNRRCILLLLVIPLCLLYILRVVFTEIQLPPIDQLIARFKHMPSEFVASIR